MARKVFQNEDLIRNIYGYGDPKHRDFTRAIGYEFKGKILSKLPLQYPYSLPDYRMIGDMNMKETLVHFFLLNRCMCCTRHAHNKPRLYLVKHQDRPWIVIHTDILRVPECKNLHNCDCDCRHVMRKLTQRISFRSALNTIKYE